ncbi:MAG: nucleotidyltransferase domain-containing protein [Chloroflexi bacterium]|nr:nucleotidyltransferase domain-containing protein [Chloroflexota bacterium]
MAGKVIEIADPILAEIVRRLVDEFRPERIYLFGSRARGDATPDSDYDVLIVLDEPVERSYRYEQRASGVLWGIRWPVDVRVMSRDVFERKLSVVASLPATIGREGNLLYAA